jgi:hypothetical protein
MVSSVRSRTYINNLRHYDLIRDTLGLIRKDKSFDLKKIKRGTYVPRFMGWLALMVMRS